MEDAITKDPSDYQKRLGKYITRIRELEAELAAAREDSAQAKNALMVSEQYRRKYAEGKYALYAMGGEFTEAAAKHLPWGSEGPLERYEMRVEREHSPLLVDHNKRLVEMLEEAKEDSARLDWLLPVLSLEDGDGDARAISLANQVMRKAMDTTITARAAIDAARKGE